ncbi:hypothetical protein MWN33_10865 [Starkeya koreensis]|uniref:Uncharacterized protein n=1 Tax=Ancylobacter koreensis TaxID=266121 RepID=A0ABT0DN19_9HYPH|nr:hypothetical protein [Ancylobacter koreensis]MCK0208532.1 hypothetical protein [Ancylobacter koreensis]
MSDAERLRAQIDAGKTRDKVPFSDPAAAPLGTDDEAAGARPAGVAPRAADAEPGTTGSGTDERGRPYDDRGTSLPGVSFMTAIVGLLVGIIGAGALAAAFLS